MLLSSGDALIDFVPAKTGDGRDALVPLVGGSCFNIAVGMARLGAPVGFVGGISTDLFGRMIADRAGQSGVDLRHAMRSPRPTTLAFVRTVHDEPQYAFYDEQTASRYWTYRRGSIEFEKIGALHVGSTTLVHGHGWSETMVMIEDARRTTTISFDPNCRPNLVPDKADYVRRMDQLAECADIVRVSDADFAYLHGSTDYASRAKELLLAQTSLFVVTQGSGGAQAWHAHAGSVTVDAPQVDVADTIGAGDSFQAALLFALHSMGCIGRGPLRQMNADQLKRALAFAADCAALTCGRRGADPPLLHELSPNSLTLLLSEGHRLP
jgi:fructokinase